MASLSEKTLDKLQGCLVGLAVGDAVGTTVEFKQRGTFEPVTDMPCDDEELDRTWGRLTGI